MALHSDLPIYRTGVKLLSLAVRVQEQMPRSVKRILGEKITQHCVDMLDLMALANAKILDNMEIGHNVMHGQYDWMNDPEIHSQRHNWDNLSIDRMGLTGHRKSDNLHFHLKGDEDELAEVRLTIVISCESVDIAN